MAKKMGVDTEDNELDNEDLLLEDHSDEEGNDDDDDSDDVDSNEGADAEGDEEGDESGGESEGESGEESEEGSGEDKEREAIRERRRQERRLKKQRAQEREEKFKRELQVRDAAISQLQQQLGVINKKNFTSELGQLDNAIENASKAYNYYKGQLSDGAKSNDGDIVADATEKMFQARQAAEHYSNIKKAILTAQNRPQAPNPRIQSLAKRWSDQNKWYDPSGANIDSRITLAIDDSMAQEGYDPATEEYWTELTSRVKKYLPHRAKMVYNESIGDGLDSRSITKKPVTAGKPKSIVAGSGRESASTKGEYHISSERKKALQEAGLWDDPKARQAAIKRFKDYDQNHDKS
jgi:hypothetical protein